MDVKAITIAAHDATAPVSRKAASATVRAAHPRHGAPVGATDGAPARASARPGSEAAHGGAKPYRPPTPDTPAGPPPSFSVTPLELHSALQTTLARINSAGYAAARGLGIAAPASLTSPSLLAPSLLVPSPPAFGPRPTAAAGDPHKGDAPEKGAAGQKGDTPDHGQATPTRLLTRLLSI